MSSPAGQSARMQTCTVCSSIPWFKLRPEDAQATPHHISGKELAESAKTCTLCSMVLHAATSNYRDSQGVRHGKGYWRQYDHVRVSVGNAKHDMVYIKEMGAGRPRGTPDFQDRKVLSINEPTGPDFRGPFSALTVIEPTQRLGSNDQPMAHDELQQLEALALENPTDSLPVWVYGNYWAEPREKKGGNGYDLRLMGVGARFGKSGMPFDAFNAKAGEFSFCGSSVGMCVSDGKWPQSKDGIPPEVF